MNKYVVVIFSDETKADEAAEVFPALHEDGSVTLYGLAIARKAEDDELTVVQKQGEGLPGAGVGALVGLVGGPFTALLGAAGGASQGEARGDRCVDGSANLRPEPSGRRCGCGRQDQHERRLDETKRQHDRRAALLQQTLELVDEARA